jgi:hypothetical protein
MRWPPGGTEAPCKSAPFAGRREDNGRELSGHARSSLTPSPRFSVRARVELPGGDDRDDRDRGADRDHAGEAGEDRTNREEWDADSHRSEHHFLLVIPPGLERPLARRSMLLEPVLDALDKGFDSAGSISAPSSLRASIAAWSSSGCTGGSRMPPIVAAAAPCRLHGRQCLGDELGDERAARHFFLSERQEPRRSEAPMTLNLGRDSGLVLRRRRDQFGWILFT